jgi:hypothetical protein
MSVGIAYNPCKNCKEMDKCSICELTYYRKGYIKSPAADVVEVKHGEWEYEQLDEYKYYKVTCPYCNAEYWGNYDAYNEPDDFNYCPNCGAKMDGDRRDENEG